MQVFEIHKGIIGGPDFNCAVANSHLAGSFETFDAKCTVGDKKKSGKLALNIRDKPHQAPPARQSRGDCDTSLQLKG